MFETDPDFDFNDDIFNISGVCPTSTSTQKSYENAKRHTEEFNVPEKNKRICNDISNVNIISEPNSNEPATSIGLFGFTEKSKLLLRRICESTVIENSENSKTIHDSQPILCKKVVERCFPGPAGLLSPKADGVCEKLSVTYSDLQENLSKSSNEDILCSQTTAIAFKSSAWLQLLDDFRTRRDNFASLPDKYNISWIKSKARKQKLVDKKAPFLAAIVQNVDFAKAAVATVTVLLKDITGEIEGTIQPDIYEKYVAKLTPGAVVVLKQFSVLTTNFGKSHHLTITPNNLVRIYVDEKHSKHVTVIKVQDISIDEVYNAIEDVEKQQTLSLLVKSATSLVSENRVSCRDDDSLEPGAYSEGGPGSGFDTRFRYFGGENVAGKPSGLSSASNARFKSKLQVQDNGTSVANDNCDNNKFNFKSFVNANRAQIGSDHGSASNASKETFKSKAIANNTKCDFKPAKQKYDLTKNDVGCANTNLCRNNNINNSRGAENGWQNSSVDNSDSDVLENSGNTVTCSQISAKSGKKEDTEILQSVFDGLDAQSFFEDF